MGIGARVQQRANGFELAVRGGVVQGCVAVGVGGGEEEAAGGGRAERQEGGEEGGGPRA